MTTTITTDTNTYDDGCPECGGVTGEFCDECAEYDYRDDNDPNDAPQCEHCLCARVCE